MLYQRSPRGCAGSCLAEVACFGLSSCQRLAEGGIAAVVNTTVACQIFRSQKALTRVTCQAKTQKLNPQTLVKRGKE